MITSGDSIFGDLMSLSEDRNSGRSIVVQPGSESKEPPEAGRIDFVFAGEI
jgi:hypothetical protein